MNEIRIKKMAGSLPLVVFQAMISSRMSFQIGQLGTAGFRTVCALLISLELRTILNAAYVREQHSCGASYQNTRLQSHNCSSIHMFTWSWSKTYWVSKVKCELRQLERGSFYIRQARTPLISRSINWHTCHRWRWRRTRTETWHQGLLIGYTSQAVSTFARQPRKA